jgi:uncharacterized protein
LANVWIFGKINLAIHNCIFYANPVHFYIKTCRFAKIFMMNFFGFLLKSIRSSSPFLRLLFALFIWVVAAAILLFISEQIAVVFFKTSLFRIDLFEMEKNPQALLLFKITTLVQSIAVFAVPPFFIAWFFSDRTTGYLSMKKSVSSWNYLWGAIIIIACIPLINFLDEINKMVHLPSLFGKVESGMNETESMIEKIYGLFSKAPTLRIFLFNMIVMAVVPAFGEELMFRGVLQRMLSDFFSNRHFGVIVCAFIFGAVHSQAHSILPRFMLGLVLGYSMLWSGSIWVSMLMHFVNNLMNIGYSLMQERGCVGNELEQIGKIHEQVWMTGVSIILLGVLLWLIYKKRPTPLESL